MSEKQTVLMGIIEKLYADSKFLNGENDDPMDKAVGQYIKSIADDLKENYLQKEKEQQRLIYEGMLQNIGTSIKQSDLPTFEQYYNETYKTDK